MLRLGLAIALAVVLFDQATKWVVLERVMVPPHLIEVWPIVNIVLVWNRGVSFGLLNSASQWTPILLSAFAIAVTLILVVWLRRTESRLLAVAIGLVIGGALGNVADRLRHGAVADFLDLHIGGYHWPAFNVADASITVGVLLILIDGIFARRQADR
jgi:signal peptidase II